MRIFLHGEELETTGGDVTLSYKSFVFSELFPDQYSTDITLPLSQHNMQILEPYGILYGIEPFAVILDVVVQIGDVSQDGRLAVSSMDASTLTATIFLSQLPPYMDEDVREYMNGAVVLPWDIGAPTTELSGHTGSPERSVFRNGMGQWQALSPYSHRMNLYLQSVLGTMGSGVNFSVPTYNGHDHRIVASEPKVSRVVSRQVVSVTTTAVGYNSPSFRTTFFAPKHPCNDAGGLYDPLDAEANGYGAQIKVTRPCKLTITHLHQFFSCYIFIGNNPPLLDNYSTPQVTYTLSEGDSIGFWYMPPWSPNSGNFWYEVTRRDVILFDWSDFTADDYEEELEFGRVLPDYRSYQVQWDGQQIVNTATAAWDYDGLSGRPRYTFANFDFFWCFPKFTFRELLTSVAHYIGQEIKYELGAFMASAVPSLTIPDEGSEVEQIMMAASELAQKLLIKWGGGSDERGQQVLEYNNGQLTEQKTLYTSKFEYPSTVNRSPYMGLAGVSIFEPGSDDATEMYRTKNVDRAIVMLTERSSTWNGTTHYYLGGIGQQATFGLEDAATSEVKVRALGDWRGSVWAYWRGFRYAIVSVEYYTETNDSLVTMILIKP